MFIVFDKDLVDHSRFFDAWGYPRTLTAQEHARLREGFKFIRICYYVMIIVFGISVAALVWLPWPS